MNKTFKAFYVTEENKQFERSIVDRQVSDLPKHDTLVEVHYSSLNYKDALSINGHKGITRNFPHQPGIDAAGIILESTNEQLKPGTKVIVTGYDLGMNTAGGLGELIRVPSEWLVPLPTGLSLKSSMAYGTAGFTAALGLWLIERNGQKPDQGELVVTGATGGVGSLAVAICSSAGYNVVASTGKAESKQDFLKQLGAKKVVNREYVDIDSEKLLLREKWAGGIDTVGGSTLHSLLKACKAYGNIACCGLVQSADLPISVYPFIINGISLLGIATAENPIEQKKLIWKKLATDWSVKELKNITSVITLEEVSDAIDLMMEGKSTGRIVVKHNVA